jgi:hypothetical protein
VDEFEFAFVEGADFVGVVEALEDDFVHGASGAVCSSLFVVRGSRFAACSCLLFFESAAERQLQILRLTTPELKKMFGAPFAQDDTRSSSGTIAA